MAARSGSQSTSARGAAPDAAGEPTLIDPSAGDASGEKRRARTPTAGGLSSMTALVALRSEQNVRVRRMLINAVLLGLLGAGALQIPSYVAPGRNLCTALALSVVAVGATLLFRSRQREVAERELTVISLLANLTWLATIFHVGVLSPVPLALFVNVYYEGLGSSGARAWVVYALSSLGYLLLIVLAVLGVIDVTRALFPIQMPELTNLVVMTAIIEIFLGMTFVLARESRGAMVGAMQRLERAQNQLLQRDALLDEARADLAGALDAGRIGRFTGQHIGPYRADEVIGRGAMGEVYSARDRNTGQPAALKLIHAAAIDDEQRVQRFFREAEVAGRLASKHIVQVLGTGYAEDGTPYLAMERLEGHDLGWHLRENRRLGFPATLALVTEVAGALAIAQDAGIVHRDVKPQNVFCDVSSGAEVWKMLDFGVSKVMEGASTLTGGAAVGTPSYMSPEQARGRAVDHRADVFSLAVIAYRALTGRPAFTGADAVASMYNVVHVQPGRPGQLAELPHDVELVLALGLAKDKDRRFRSSTSFAAALRDAGRSELDPRLRDDAEALLGAEPWAQDLTELPSHARRKKERGGEG